MAAAGSSYPAPKQTNPANSADGKSTAQQPAQSATPVPPTSQPAAAEGESSLHSKNMDQPPTSGRGFDKSSAQKSSALSSASKNSAADDSSLQSASASSSASSSKRGRSQTSCRPALSTDSRNGSNTTPHETRGSSAAAAAFFLLPQPSGFLPSPVEISGAAPLWPVLGKFPLKLPLMQLSNLIVINNQTFRF
jgi:hypothetical protein